MSALAASHESGLGVAPSISLCLGSGLLTTGGIGVGLVTGLTGVLELGSSIGSELWHLVDVRAHRLPVPLVGALVEELDCSALAA